MFAAVTILAMTIPQSSAVAQKPFAFGDGDRVVFLGDSITQYGEYPLYLECFLLEQHPDLKLTFRNLGWGSDRAWLHQRTADNPSLNGDAMLKMPPGDQQEAQRAQMVAHGLERDVLPLRPSVVFIMYGACDVRDGEQSMELHLRSLAQIIARLKQADCRVVLLAPPPDDDDSKYNAMHEKWGVAVRELAEKEQVYYIDVYHAVEKSLAEARKADPNFAYTRDRVHPHPAGHALIARAIAAGLGMDPAQLKTDSPLLPQVTAKNKAYFHRWREVQLPALVAHKLDDPEVQTQLRDDDRRVAQLESEIEQLRGK
jgi:lysophospholipase L1-like esterase